ncbi:hypothetical protein [Streptomyces naphthomycinicus]|uniref:hypothetical protein n=1 Tax=Streptomyces naphthomycinicus TaxID=2872625 RepID=UPI001CED37D2|nr:hypothetical protein [Streptomyces sp. TML10]
MLHARLVEAPGDRVRILTQETQIGRPAAELARQTPNPMLNGHQAWLDGLVRAAAGRIGVRSAPGHPGAPSADGSVRPAEVPQSVGS